MPMISNGLPKLLEELAELSQVAAKKLAYPDTDAHPDGAGSLKLRMQEEIGDVLAAIDFVVWKYGLEWDEIELRTARKALTYQIWDTEPT